MPRPYLRILGIVAALLVLGVVTVGYRRIRRKTEAWPEGVHATSWSQFETKVASHRGHPTLVTLWAAWCHDCVNELPELAVAVPELTAKGVAYEPLSIDETPHAMLTLFAKTEKPTFDLVRVEPVEEDQIYAAVKRLGGSYDGSIPYNLLLDKDGKVVREWRGKAVSRKDLVAAASALL